MLKTHACKQIQAHILTVYQEVLYNKSLMFEKVYIEKETIGNTLPIKYLINAHLNECIKHDAWRLKLIK